MSDDVRTLVARARELLASVHVDAPEDRATLVEVESLLNSIDQAVDDDT